jgi:hypothetical protein
MRCITQAGSINIFALPTDALAASGEQIRFAADQGFPLFHATGIVYEAAALLLRGHANASLPGLIKGLDAYRGTGAALALPYYFGLLGNAPDRLETSEGRRQRA